uniref:Reverse transcriptase/retrotransposon-derived protein RNase H-like domain-containing protein n=1 Tax=Amphimedon queenslandica TaxID=400682 RepID=A0A1X7VGK5_AMPQE
MRNLKLSLLVLPAISELRFKLQVNGLDEQSVKEHYPSLIEGLGTFKREYDIKFQHDEQPHTLCTACTVSLPLHKKVKEELDRMEGLGAITKLISLRNGIQAWLNHKGISADPSKTSAIAEMKQPTSLSELRRFMGMVNQLGKFTPHLAELAQPLRELLCTTNAWVWGPSREEAFQNIEDEMVKPTMLSIHHPDAPVLMLQHLDYEL